MIGPIGPLARRDHALAIVDQQNLDGRSAAIHAEKIHAAIVAESLSVDK
jgi:hypothetical protein